jgi:hypothetical protein
VLIITGDNIKFEFGVRATDGDRREIARYVKDDLEPGLYWFCFCGPVNEGHEPDFRIADHWYSVIWAELDTGIRVFITVQEHNRSFFMETDRCWNSTLGSVLETTGMLDTSRAGTLTKTI